MHENKTDPLLSEVLQVNLKAHKSTANLDTQQFMKALSLEQFAWINTHYSINRYEALVGDAGFRQYFRLYTTEKTYIFMDSSAESSIYQAFIQQTRDLQN
ncbi:MAG: hypothetical protein LRY67_05165 [Gammaproteobacteria bacterium]|nr:hypothetical protein [Gammaproteobacteria bacterium]